MTRPTREDVQAWIKAIPRAVSLRPDVVMQLAQSYLAALDVVEAAEKVEGMVIAYPSSKTPLGWPELFKRLNALAENLRRWREGA